MFRPSEGKAMLQACYVTSRDVLIQGNNRKQPALECEPPDQCKYRWLKTLLSDIAPNRIPL